MGAKPAVHSFKALVEQEREDIAFEPLAPFENAMRFEIIAAGQASEPVEPAVASSEPYQRMQSSSVDRSQEFAAKLAEREREAEDLRHMLRDRDDELEQLKTSHAVALDQALETARAEIGMTVHQGLAAIEGKLNVAVSADVAAILAPFVSAELHKRIVDEFSATLRNILSSGEALKIRIHGPREYEPVIRRLVAADDTRFQFIESDTSELSADIDGKLISSRFEHWSRILTGKPKNE